MTIQGNKIRLCSAVLVAMFAFPANTQSTATVREQHSPDNNQPAAMGGVKTGTPRAPVLDSEHRPITAGWICKGGAGHLRGHLAEFRSRKMASHHGNAGEELHCGNRWLGRRPDRL